MRLDNRPERAPLPFLKRALVAGLAAGQLAACSLNPTAADYEPSETTQATSIDGADRSQESHVTQLWGDALFELRDKIDSSETVELQVAWGQCLRWPASIEGVFTVVRNPAMYTYEHDGELLMFVPFTASQRDVPIVMNGPYQYFENLETTEGRGILGAAEPSDAALSFEPTDVVLSVRQEADPTPFTAAWLQDEEGRRISETMLVLEEDLDDAFSETCDFSPGPVVS